MEVAELIAERDRSSPTAAELAANEAALRRAVLTLWQTNPLRSTRLRVIDEVANGLSYYDHTFLAGLPRFYADLEEELAGAGVALARRPSLVSAPGQLDRRRPRRQSLCDRRAYCARHCGPKRRAPSITTSTNCISSAASCLSTPAGRRFGCARGARRAIARSIRPPTNTSPTGAPSPGSMRAWRRRRGCSTASRLAQQAVGDAPAYRDSDELLADLVDHRRSLVANGSAILAAGG